MKSSEAFIIDRFISGTGPAELAEIGKLHYMPERSVKLPPPRKIQVSLSDILRTRRSSRTFDCRWSSEDLSTLLANSYGVTQTTKQGKKLRAYPSPGGLYPNDLFLIVTDVADINKGLYIYDVYQNCLVFVTDDVGDIIVGFPEIKLVSTAKVIVTLIGNPFRTYLKYGEMGYKFLLLDAGIIIESIVLTAVALNKNVLPYETYLDDQLNIGIGLDGVRKFVTSTVLLG